MPDFAPRASATVLFCSPVAGSSLKGNLDEKSKRASVVGAVFQKSQKKEENQFMRIRFDAKTLKVALGSYGENMLVWGPDFDYTVNSDAPQDFIATRAGSGEMGMLQTLAINRVAGAAMLTLTVASLGGGGYPYTSSTFFVCQP